MVDLKGQYAGIKDVVNPSIQEVIETTAFINGPKVHEFQKNLESYLGVKHVIPCANGTDALQIATIGANYKYANGTKVKAGTIGNVGATSFFPSKNLGCYGDGGAIFTNDDDLAHTIRGIVNHGMYERYHHDVVGVNSRLDSIQAAVLDAKLPHLDAYNNARQNAARKYNQAFKDIESITTPKTVNGCDGICDACDCHVFHQYTLKLNDVDRDALVKHLNDNGIPCGVYYPIPLHKQKAYVDARYQEADFQVTNQLVKSVISLPMHTELDDEQIEYITSTIITFING